MSEKRIIFIYSGSFYLLTWDYVTKPNCGHSDETEVEGIKECEILIDTNKVGTKAEEDNKEEKSSTSCLDIASKPNFFFFLPNRTRRIKM